MLCRSIFPSLRCSLLRPCGVLSIALNVRFENSSAKRSKNRPTSFHKICLIHIASVAAIFFRYSLVIALFSLCSDFQKRFMATMLDDTGNACCVQAARNFQRSSLQFRYPIRASVTQNFLALRLYATGRL